MNCEVNSDVELVHVGRSVLTGKNELTRMFRGVVNEADQKQLP